MSYKKPFYITLIALLLLISVFILIPLAFGYNIGFINKTGINIENLYYVFSVLIAGVVAFFTYKIYKRQLSLMEEQKEISKAQTKISEKQTEIMEQQNKIALFEKRNMYFQKIELIFHFISPLSELVENEAADGKDYFNVWIEHFNTPLMVSTFGETKTYNIASEVEKEYANQDIILKMGEFIFSDDLSQQLHEVHTTYLDLIRYIIDATFYKEEFRYTKLLNFKNKLDDCLTHELFHVIAKTTNLYE